MQQKATEECDYVGQGTGKVRYRVLTICWKLSILDSSTISVYFVQHTHILNANCEGQSDSQSNGHSIGLLNLKIYLSLFNLCQVHFVYLTLV